MAKKTLAQLFEELEKVVSTVEDKDTQLEKSVTEFKHGLEIAKQIKSQLATVEDEVSQLTKEFSDLEKE